MENEIESINLKMDPMEIMGMMMKSAQGIMEMNHKNLPLEVIALKVSRNAILQLFRFGLLNEEGSRLGIIAQEETNRLEKPRRKRAKDAPKEVEC